MLLHRPWFSLTGLVRRLAAHRARPAAPDSDPASHLSLLSVVKQKRGTRYMAVDQILGEWAECAWVEAGLRRKAWFAVSELEVVPALGPDDANWRAAFRAGDNRRVG